MLTSLKKWVQDVAVDLTPPSPPQQSPSSPSLLSSSSKSGSAQHYYYSSTPSHEQQHYNERLSTHISSSPMGLSRPISMDSVRSSKMFNPSIQPPPASPVELDLSHLNREEQEHIANVLRRARAADEQQSPAPTVVVPSIQSPQASIVSASLSPSASSSSSTSTSSYYSEKPGIYEQNDKNDNNDDNEIYDDEEPPAPSPESTLITIHRCQVCNKEQQGNTTICLQCQDDEEVARVTENNTTPLTPTRQLPSPIPIEFNNHEEDKIYDNVTRIDQELIKRNSPIRESHLAHHYTKNMNDNQDQEKEEEEEDKEKQLSPPAKIRSNNLTEIDENDFFYQEPSPYTTSIENNNIMPDKIEEPSIPSYQIDEYIDEDDADERDHVKELEETIANLTRHFPVSSEDINDIEIKPIVTNLHQPSTLSVGKIDIDSILEMEIESPSTDEHFPQSSSSIRPSSISSQHSVNIPISVPISINNRRGSLSRSSGVRENLTDLLATTTMTESHPSDDRPLQRAASVHTKHIIPIQRQKRNLPSVPTMINHLELRRANSESRFSLPAVPPSIQITNNSNIDDESDLLEIDLNDPTGSMKRTSRSKTESEINNSNDQDYRLKTFHPTNQSPSIDELSSPKKQIKQLRDQTTNTPPISSLNSTTKIKKKLKKKGSSSPNNTNGHHTNSPHINGQITPVGISPSRSNPPSVVLPPSTTNINRPKLQKSTSTEMSYPFPVLKLILNHDKLNPSRRDGNDLGLRITGGHSFPNCMEVTACIEHIDTRHRNYNILKNAVEEGDEVLEVGGVSLRGKSALFVENLMNSIQNEFEIVVRSQHIILPISSPIEISKPENINAQNNLTVSSLVDPNTQRRHSMDTSQFSPTHQTNNTVVKSQSTFMSSPLNNSSNVSDQLLAPTTNRKKSVSSKERLFSVETLHRSPSSKSIEHFMKIVPQPSDTKENYSPEPVQKSPSLIKQTSLSVAAPENINHKNEELTSLSQPSQNRRIYEHRNSLLPNDPGLNKAGSNHSIDRRNSNESDESDNLSQYFGSPSSRKSSLMPTNDQSNNQNIGGTSNEHNQNIITDDNETVTNASRRLQNFLKSSNEKRQSRGSTGGESINLNRIEERKSSGALSSIPFLKKKTKSVDLTNQPIEIRENDYVGDIELQIGHNSEREQLVVRLIKAKNLLAKDTNGFSDPFVKVYLLPGRDQENKRRTKHIAKNLNPVWDHTVVYGNMHQEELQYKMLEFTLWDYDRFKANDFLGQVTIDLKDGNVIDDKPHWYRLQALRSREEATNRGSSPRLFKMTSADSSTSSTTTLNKNSVNMQSRGNQRK